MPRRITEITDEFKSGLWQAEVSKRDNGQSVISFGYGKLYDPGEVYQDNEVTSLLDLMDQVKEFLDEPMELEPEAVDEELPPAPISKADLIRVLNEGRIKNITCETEFEGGTLTFGMYIITEDNRSFYFGQDFGMPGGLSDMEIIDFTSGNGRVLPFSMGKGFDPANRTDLNIRPDWENADMGWK